jgi:hypothetical protein
LAEKANETQQGAARQAGQSPVSTTDAPSSGRPRQFWYSYGYYFDYVAGIAIACGFIVYFLDPDIGNTWGWGVAWIMVLALIATMFIGSAVLAIKVPVATADPEPSPPSAAREDAQGPPPFLKPFYKYLVFCGLWVGGVLLFDPDVTLTTGMLMASGLLVIVLSALLAVLRPSGPDDVT